MSKSRRVALIVIALLVIASIASSFLQADPIAVAKAACVESGWQADGIQVLEFRQSGYWAFAERCTVLVASGGRQSDKRARISMFRAAYFLPYRVDDWKEQPKIDGFR